MAKGNDESSAYAICTTSLQDAGEPIFEAAEMHHLHLLAATGTTRTEMYQGREYLVVPVVALMEGVIHAVNAKNREFVPLTTLQKAAQTWNDRPVVLFHPQKAGKQCSANSPDVIASHGLGLIRNSRVEGSKLLQEAWIEKSKAKKLHPRMYEDLEANKTVEVSVGAFVVTDEETGSFNGRDFLGNWVEATGDHLAFLPGSRGACSVEMGCGTCRAAMAHLVTAEGFIPMEEDGLVTLGYQKKECPACDGSGSAKGNPCEACDGTGELRVAGGPGSGNFGHEGRPGQIGGSGGGGGSDRISTDPGDVARRNEKSKQVKDEWLRSARFLEDSTLIQASSGGEHSTSITPAAAVKPQLRAAGCGCHDHTECGCKRGVGHMEKAQKAEIIAALVTDRYSGFKDADQAMLETASDARLEEFRAAADRARLADANLNNLQKDLTNTNARLKVAEDRLKASEQTLSEDEFIARAPASIKTLLDAHKAQEEQHRAGLISRLKECGANTEAELKAKSTDDLETLAAYAQIRVPDYSGQGVPKQRNAADKDNYAPPNPYEAGLAAMRSKAVN